MVVLLAAVPDHAPAQVTPAGERSSEDAVLEGVVSDHETGAPIAGAEVTLVPLAGEGRAVTLRLTDDEGRFAFTRVTPGTYGLRVGMLGFRTREDTLELAPRTVTRVGLDLSVSPIPLDPLSVEVEARPWRSWEMEGFERRRARRSGAFFDREDIEDHLAFRVSDILRTVPNVGIVEGRPENLRGALTNRRCLMPVFVDGLRTAVGMDTDIPPDMIEAIEVYTSLAETPIQYRTGPCGAVLIWLRSGPASGPAAEGSPGRLWKAFGAVAAVASVLWVLSR